MKKTGMIIGLVFALALSVLAVEYKYIEKAKNVSSGNIADCWRCQRATIMMDQNVEMTLVMNGYKDVAAFVAGKTNSGLIVSDLDNVQEMPEYNEVFLAILGKLTEAGSVFAGGILKEKTVGEGEDAVTYQYIEKNIECGTGDIAQCWRSQMLKIKMGESVTISVRMLGYSDIDAFVAGKSVIEVQKSTIDNAQEMPEYSTAFTAIFNKLTEAGEDFEGGILKTVEIEE